MTFEANGQAAAQGHPLQGHRRQDREARGLEVAWRLLRVEQLTVRYGALIALADMSWQVDAGEILGIIGPNGAGKSSCFAAVTHAVRRERHASGWPTRTSPACRRMAGRRGLRRTFQQNAFFGELTLLENAMAAMLRRAFDLAAALDRPALAGARDTPARRSGGRRAADLASASAADDHGKRPGDIAYGTQRLLSVVLAYGAGARALLIDEPAAGIGGTTCGGWPTCWSSCAARGVAVVVIEHHMDLIMAIADRIVVIDQGRKLAEGTPAEIQRNAAVLEAYLGRAA